MNTSRFTAIDLFAGGGGLSEGLRRCRFEIVAAVENDYDAAQTFKINHPETVVFYRDIKHLPANSLKNLLKNRPLDLLAGCPPCQGFSSLTNKYKREDIRNSLVYEMERIIIALKPKIIMMENVPGLAKKGNTYFNNFLETIKNEGYIPTWKILQVADYGVPQLRKRLVLLAAKNISITIPEPTHSNNNESNKKPWVTVRQALSAVPQPIKFKEAKLLGDLNKCKWNVTRELKEINLKRLKHIPPGGNRFFIPDHLRPQCHKGNNKGFQNVYGRLAWDKPSPTITGGCTTLSKGRFGHPDQMRTLSVREAATLQGFPMDYQFATEKIDQACQIIGNALPITFAEAMAQSCLNILQSENFEA